MTAGRKQGFAASSLGFRLGSTLVMALLPLGILSLVQTWVALDQMEETTLDGIGGASREAVRPQIDLIRDAQTGARTLASMLSAGTAGGEGCSARLAAVSEAIPQATMVAYVPAEGPITCASTEDKAKLAEDPFIAALPTLPEPSLRYNPRGPVSGGPVIVVGAPVVDRLGAQTGAIGILIVHQAITPRPFQSDYGLWQPALMATFTGDGRLLAADRDVPEIAGLLPEGLAPDRLEERVGDPFYHRGAQGKRQIVSVTRVADDLYLLALWQHDTAAGWSTSLAPFLLPLLTWAAALLAASIASQRLVVRHVRALSRSMTAYMASRRPTPVPGIAGSPAEIQKLHGVYEELIGAIEQDEAELENLLIDKDRLLHEVHHRSGNSLQVIASIMRMYRRESADPDLRGVLDGLINRVIALSSTHTSLYGLEGRHDVPMDEVLNAVILRLKAIHGIAIGSARKRFEPILLPAQTAIPLALALAETVSCHFAAKEGMRQGIEVSLLGSGKDICLKVEGPDVPEFRPGTTQGLAALPRRILMQFAAQLRGRVVTRIEDGRSVIELTFPREPD